MAPVQKKELDAINRKLGPLMARKHELEMVDLNAKAQALVGRCFKYHNSYGSDSPKWWVYAKVVRAQDAWPMAMKFQETSSGRMEVAREEGRFCNEGWAEITEQEFDAAWGQFVDAVSTVNTTAATV